MKIERQRRFDVYPLVKPLLLFYSKYWTGIFLLLLMVGQSGCGSVQPRPAAQLPTRSSNASVALAIRMADGRSPTREQASLIQKALAAQIEKQGYFYASDPRDASLLLVVSFVPDPLNPPNGNITLVGVEKNDTARRLSVSGETEAMREVRRQQKEFERWVESQNRTRPLESNN